MRTLIYTISESDIGKTAYSKNIDRNLALALLSVCGPKVLPADIGKQIWIVNGIMYIENSQQRDERNARSQSGKKASLRKGRLAARS